jgi:hypothetical protein
MPARKLHPTYPLGDVQQLVKKARIGPSVLRRTRQDCGLDEMSDVKAFIIGCIRKLANADFAYSEEQEYDSGPIFADIYGLVNSRRAWFIKFYLEHGQLTIASCHAPDRDIVCADGKRIKAT